jgi:carboxyl-terminal processing protease
MPGDEIVSINNIPLSQLDIEQLVQVLTMTRQKQAALYVRRQGTAKLLQLTLTPAEMQSPSVDRAFLLEPGVAFIRITSFDEATGREFQAAVEKLGGAALQGLVLDLRNNGGGVLTAGLETAALFLRPGQLILSARGRSAETREVKTPDNVKPYEFPVALLVNEKTASAAEIVAGALQDHRRARVVGVRTYGKGLVQSVYPLKEGTGLALTTAFYYTPNGRSIQRPLKDVELAAATRSNEAGGILPDDIVPLEAPSRLRAVLEINAAFSGFATEWLRKNRAGVTPALEIDAAMLGDFQLWLSQRNVRPGIGEWTAEGAFLRRRLKQEILNLSLGVQAGDEVEFRADPAVRRALPSLRRP